MYVVKRDPKVQEVQTNVHKFYKVQEHVLVQRSAIKCNSEGRGRVQWHTVMAEEAPSGRYHFICDDGYMNDVVCRGIKSDGSLTGVIPYRRDDSRHRVYFDYASKPKWVRCCGFQVDFSLVSKKSYIIDVVRS